jgi:hypothetical protein
VVPDTYDGYFTASTAAAGALIGLLFVAIVLRPDTVFGPNAPIAGRMLAGSAFTGLVNAFFVSLIALIPQVNLGVAGLVLSGFSIFATIRTHRSAGGLHANWALLTFSMLAYTAQAVDGVLLLVKPHESGPVTSMCYVIVAAYAVSIARAWALLRDEHLNQAPVKPASVGSGTNGAAQ